MHIDTLTATRPYPHQAVAMSVSVITKPVLTCGEGPHWDAATQSLIYVDIQGDAVHRWNSVTGEDSCIKLGRCRPTRRAGI